MSSRAHGKSLYCRTPLIEDNALSDAYGAPVYIKLENAQPAGSFKIRGLGALCQEAQRQGAHSVVLASGGNAGLALANAARRLGLIANVVVSRQTTSAMIERLGKEKASVHLEGNTWEEANAWAQCIAASQGSFYCHPFNSPVVWAGNSTMIPEIYDDLDGERPGGIVASVGGGGLVCGLCQGADKVGWNRVPIIAVETAGADSFNASVKAGALVELPKVTSIAVSLGIRKVCPKVWEYYQERSISSLVVTDKEAVDACWKFADENRMLVEPSCGASLAAVYGKRVNALRTSGIIDPMRPLVVIVCGGSAVTIGQLQTWQRFFDEQSQLPSREVK